MDAPTSATERQEAGRPARWRTPLLWLLLPLLAGYVAAEALPGLPVGAWLLPGSMLAFGLGLTLWKDFLGPKSTAGLMLIAATMLAGGYYSLRRAPALPATWEGGPPREVRIAMRVDQRFRQPDLAGPVRGLGTLVGTEPTEAALVGTRLSFRLPPGSIAEVGGTYGTVAVIEPTPAEGDFARYLQRQGVRLLLDKPRVWEEQSSPSGYHRAQALAGDRLEAILLPEGRADTDRAHRLLAAMMLGDTDLVPADALPAFVASGTLHYFAISGLHVVAVAATLDLLLRALRLGRISRTWGMLILLFAYLWATGLAPSAVRAGLMIAFWCLGRLARLPVASLPALVGTALLVLLVEPRQIWSPGFQLSYLVTAAILLYGVPLGQAWRERLLLFPWLPRASWRWHHHLRQGALDNLAVALAISLAATLASWPLGVLYFHASSPGAWLLNVVLGPLSGLAMAGGVLAMLAGLLGLEALGQAIAHGPWLLLTWMDALIGTFLTLPGASEVRGWRSATLAWLLIASLFAGLLRLIQAGRAGRRSAKAWQWALPVAAVAVVVWLGSVARTELAN